jgi:hypothetical protein
MTVRAFSIFLRASVALSAGVFAVEAFAAGPTPLLAHRAIYDLTLGKSEGSSAPSRARGRIVYEFSGSACDGYVTNFRQITELEMNEGGTRTSDLRSSTFEEGDGSGFRFKSDTYIDSKLMESVDGKAARAPDGQAVSVDISKPTPRKADLSPGAVFPTAQMLIILEAARKGERTAEVPIFDGSDNGQKIFDTTSLIGNRATAPSSDKVAEEAEALKDIGRWPVSVSYFDTQKADGTPNYVLAFDLYENGVSGKLRIDYGNYSLNGVMSKFEALPQKACEK